VIPALDGCPKLDVVPQRDDHKARLRSVARRSGSVRERRQGRPAEPDLGELDH
jgi:hypothetical protein